MTDTVQGRPGTGTPPPENAMNMGTKMVLTCGQSVLTLLRDDVGGITFPGHWDLPGGGIDPGETPLECGLRELREETGLVLAPDRTQGGHWRDWPPRPGGIMWYFYAGITPAEAGSARLGSEGSDLRMMGFAEFIAHPLTIPPFRDIVRELLTPAV